MREQGRGEGGSTLFGSVLSASSQSLSSRLLLPTDFSRVPKGFPRGPLVPPGPLYVPLPAVSLELFAGQLHVSPVGGTIHTGHSPAGM